MDIIHNSDVRLLAHLALTSIVVRCMFPRFHAGMWRILVAVCSPMRRN